MTNDTDRSESILKELRAKGFRITRARSTMVRILSDSPSPLGAPEMARLMKELGSSVNKTTIYRELEFLMAQALITEVLVGDGMRRYELMPEGRHHHHHLVCNECSAVECVEVERCVEEDVRAIEKKSDFKVTDHSLKFFGLCAKCRT